MAALLLNIQKGDEVILPAFTFPSTANAFLLRGATLRFADSCSDDPNVDVASIRALISENTKAVVIIHYAGVPAEMDSIAALCREKGVALIEDAAQALGARYKGRFTGSFGIYAAFSFHETKNVGSGEGGLLVVQNKAQFDRAEIIWEKGTNRAALHRGETDHYHWMDLGSSYLPSELQSAFLLAQLEAYDMIMSGRKKVWDYHWQKLSVYAPGIFQCMHIPGHVEHNYHQFHILCKDKRERDALEKYMRSQNILAISHYRPLHISPYYLSIEEQVSLPHAERYADTILRLPMYPGLPEKEADILHSAILTFYGK